jgi:protein-S-isoprenylcysteine O-methyltransferase Ste14
VPAKSVLWHPPYLGMLAGILAVSLFSNFSILVTTIAPIACVSKIAAGNEGPSLPYLDYSKISSLHDVLLSF